jgi:hypothetical protein
LSTGEDTAEPMRRYLAVALAATALTTGCTSAKGGDGDTADIAKAAESTLTRAVEENSGILTRPLATFLKAAVTGDEVTSQTVDHPGKDKDHAVLRQERTVRVGLTPIREAAPMLRVVPEGGLSITVKVSASVPMSRIGGHWAVAGQSETQLPSGPLSDGDTQAVRGRTGTVIDRLLTYDGDIDRYNKAQGDFYATKAGAPGLIIKPDLTSVADPSRLDPPPTLALRGPPGPKQVVPGGGERDGPNEGSAWIRPSQPPDDPVSAGNAALWLREVLTSRDLHYACEQFDLSHMSAKPGAMKIVKQNRYPLHDAVLIEGDTSVTGAGWSRCDGGFGREGTGTRGDTTIKVGYRALLVRFHTDQAGSAESWFVAGLSLAASKVTDVPILPEAGSENLYETDTQFS